MQLVSAIEDCGVIASDHKMAKCGSCSQWCTLLHVVRVSGMDFQSSVQFGTECQKFFRIGLESVRYLSLFVSSS